VVLVKGCQFVTVKDREFVICYAGPQSNGQGPWDWNWIKCSGLWNELIEKSRTSSEEFCAVQLVNPVLINLRRNLPTCGLIKSQDVKKFICIFLYGNTPFSVAWISPNISLPRARVRVRVHSHTQMKAAGSVAVSGCCYMFVRRGYTKKRFLVFFNKKVWLPFSIKPFFLPFCTTS
jgi:hypothetical protein